MKSTLNRVLSFIALGAALCTYTAKADVVNYASTLGSSINFDGAGNFSFAPADNNLQITLDGTATGLLGYVSGTYSIGAITPLPPFGATAPVTGTGTFVIHDGALNDLVGNLVWVEITQLGAGDLLNINGVLNLTGITYSGANPTLQKMAAAGNLENVLTFQFTPAVPLSGLKTAVHSTSFSGSIAVPDGGTTVLLLGLALAGLAAFRRFRVA